MMLIAFVIVMLAPLSADAGVIVGEEPCLAIEGHPPFQDCVDTFKSYFLQESSFWSVLCSVQGRLTADCLVDYGAVCPDIWSTEIVATYDLSVFQTKLIDMNVTCEVENNPQCASTQLCFLSVFGVESSRNLNHTGLSEFFGFFCGPDYIRRTGQCIANVDELCPFTVANLRSQNVTITPNGSFIDYQRIETLSAKQCQTDISYEETRVCMEENAKELETCTLPEIKIGENVIQCKHHTDTEQCITSLCGPGAAYFFTNMSEILQCGIAALACSSVIESNGQIWPTTFAGKTVTVGCPEGETGTSQRVCSSAGDWNEPVHSCTPLYTFDSLLDDLGDLQDGEPGLNDSQNLSDILKNLTVLTATKNPIESKEDLGKLVEIIEVVVNITKAGPPPTPDITTAHIVTDSLIGGGPEENTEFGKYCQTFEPTANFMQVINNMMDPVNIKPWRVLLLEDGIGLEIVLKRVEEFLAVVQSDLCSSPVSDTQQNFTFPHLYNQVAKVSTGNYVFPDRTKVQVPWIQRTSTEFYVQAESFSDLPFLCIGSSYIRDVSEVVTPKQNVNGTVQDISNIKRINSGILALQLSTTVNRKIDPPIRLVFQLFKPDFINPECSFWDFDAPGTNGKGAWSSEGCVLVSFNGTEVVCHCDHLTNFCVLMSPQDLSNTKALNIISAIGCAVSMVGLVLTILVHWFVWRLVKSDRAVILMNLCVALLLALTIFLVGVDKTQSKAACTAIAALLHFLFLAVFCLMLLEGIEIFICVVHVFVTRFRIKLILPVAWIIPAVIVAISLGVNKLEGYGNGSFCWLETNGGLIYAFIGPVAFIILVNIVVIIVVFWKMSRSNIIKSKSTKVKAKTALRSLCVLLPLLGLTWVFGFLSIIEDMDVFKYLFAIINSLQGLFIFLFHCVFNRQIRDAWKARQARKRSLASFDSTRNKSLSNRRESNDTTGSPNKKVRPKSNDTDETARNSNSISSYEDTADNNVSKRRGGLPPLQGTDPFGWQRQNNIRNAHR